MSNIHIISLKRREVNTVDISSPQQFIKKTKKAIKNSKMYNIIYYYETYPKKINELNFQNWKTVCGKERNLLNWLNNQESQ